MGCGDKRRCSFVTELSPSLKRVASSSAFEHIRRSNSLEVAVVLEALVERLRAVTSRRILIVDDHQANITHVADFLRFKNYNVEVAYDGKQAIEMATEYSPDIILMDIQMPVISGFEAMRILRANEETADIKIIAVTARAAQKDREACLEAGADGYLSKPFKLATLNSTIENMLSISPD